MIGIYVKRLLVSACFLLVLVLSLAACGNATGASNNAATPTSTRSQELSANPTMAQATATPPASTPVVVTPTSPSGSGPMVISTPTLVPGGNPGSQLVTLADRTLAIQNVSKQPGSVTNSTAVSLVLTMKNTGNVAIPNQPGYYQLVGSEGDMFGAQASASFFGTIAPHSSHSGSVVFQVPTAAVGGLRLLFRSEIATETVFVRLTIS